MWLDRVSLFIHQLVASVHNLLQAHPNPASWLALPDTLYQGGGTCSQSFWCLSLRWGAPFLHSGTPRPQPPSTEVDGTEDAGRGLHLSPLPFCRGRVVLGLS